MSALIESPGTCVRTRPADRAWYKTPARTTSYSRSRCAGPKCCPAPTRSGSLLGARHFLPRSRPAPIRAGSSHLRNSRPISAPVRLIEQIAYLRHLVDSYPRPSTGAQQKQIDESAGKLAQLLARLGGAVDTKLAQFNAHLRVAEMPYVGWEVN